jgi:hypothetical protein
MSDAYDIVRVMYKDGDEIAKNLRTIGDAAGRLEMTGLPAGSPTHQNALHSAAVGMLDHVSSGQGGFIGAAQKRIAEFLQSLVVNPDTLFDVVSTQEGMKLFSVAAKNAMSPSATERVSSAAFKAAMQQLAGVSASKIGSAMRQEDNTP